MDLELSDFYSILHGLASTTVSPNGAVELGRGLDQCFHGGCLPSISQDMYVFWIGNRQKNQFREYGGLKA